MKDSRYGNRGQAFESLLRFANDRYRQKGVAVITKQATEFKPLRNASGKIVSAKVENKATVDFLGAYKGRAIAIEAKHTSTDSIRFDAVQPHQVAFMNDFCKQPGVIGLVAISFGMKHFYVVPWLVWKTAYDARIPLTATKTAPVTVSAYGTTWTIPKKKSVRMDELNPLWSIPNHDYDFGLHYLRDAEKYIVNQPKI